MIVSPKAGYYRGLDEQIEIALVGRRLAVSQSTDQHPPARGHAEGRLQAIMVNLRPVHRRGNRLDHVAKERAQRGGSLRLGVGGVLALDETAAEIQKDFLALRHDARPHLQRAALLDRVAHRLITDSRPLRRIRPCRRGEHDRLHRRRGRWGRRGVGVASSAAGVSGADADGATVAGGSPKTGITLINTRVWRPEVPPINWPS